MPINSFLYPAPSTPSFGYDVANSVRTNKADQPKGEVTQGTPTNVDKYTFSVWVKRADIGASNSKIFSVSSGSTYGEEKLEFNQDDLIWRQTRASDGETVWQRVTDRKFRDPSAWYHIVVAYDSSQGTAANRCKMYINGVEETSFSGSSNPSSGLDSYTNTSGRAFKFFTYLEDSNVTQDATAYFAEMVYIDGQQLDQTSFGEFDSDSPNVWKPIDVSGLTFGNNGFYLDFEDSSDLGADVSGNNNDMNLTNIAAVNQSTDTCTNNFATLNSLVKGNASITLSEGNLKGVFPGSWTAIPATFGLTKGKWYFEAKNETSGQNAFIGVVTENQDWDDSTPYDETTGVVLYGPGGRKTVDGTDTDGFFATLSSGQIVGVALDLDSSTKTIQFSVNGTDTPNSTPVDLPSTFDDVFIFPYFSGNSSSATSNWQVNFGSPSYSISSGNSDANGYGNFEYSVPSGFYSINTKNLAEFG